MSTANKLMCYIYHPFFDDKNNTLSLFVCVVFSPAPVHKLHRLHCQRCCDDIISVVSPSAHHHQPIHLSRDKHQPTRAYEAQQASPSEGVLADRSPRTGHGENLTAKQKPNFKRKLYIYRKMQKFPLESLLWSHFSTIEYYGEMFTDW